MDWKGYAFRAGASAPDAAAAGGVREELLQVGPPAGEASGQGGVEQAKPAYGRISKTLHILRPADEPGYRRQIKVQANSRRAVTPSHGRSSTGRPGSSATRTAWRTRSAPWAWSSTPSCSGRRSTSTPPSPGSRPRAARSCGGHRPALPARASQPEPARPLRLHRRRPGRRRPAPAARPSRAGAGRGRGKAGPVVADQGGDEFAGPRRGRSLRGRRAPLPGSAWGGVAVLDHLGGLGVESFLGGLLREGGGAVSR